MAERDNEKEIEKRGKREEKRDGFPPFTLTQDHGIILDFLMVMVRSFHPSTLIQDLGTILGFPTVMVRIFHQI